MSPPWPWPAPAAASLGSGLSVTSVSVVRKLVERRDGLHECRATARDDALFDRCTSGRKRVLDAVLLLLELDLCRGADLDDGDAAGQLREALLELLAVVVRGGLLDLRLD